MAGPFLRDRPFLAIGDKTFSSPIIWDWFQSVKIAGGTLMITDQDPSYTYMENGEQVYPNNWARRYDPSEISTGGGHVWIWAMMPGQDFSEHGGNLSRMASHHLLMPIYATSTDKLTGIEIKGDSISLFGPWSGDGRFWRDFGLATLATVAIAVTAGTLVPGIPSTVTGGAAISAAAPTALTPWEIATAGMAEGMGTGGTIAAASSATAWEIATAGMAEGMGTGGTIAATSGGILSTAQTVGGSVVSGARAVAGAATATRAAIDTIQAAANGTPQSTSNAPQQNTSNAPQQNTNNSALLILGLAALLLT